MRAVGLGQGSQAVGSVFESLACQKIYDPEISEILRGSLRKLSALSEKIFSTENHDTPPPPLLIHSFIRYWKLSETQYRRVPLQSFSILPDKQKSTANRDITL